MLDRLFWGEKARSNNFLSRIDRPDLPEKIKPQKPLFYVSPEFALDQLGGHKRSLGYAGGLGILSGDHVLQLAKTGLPSDAIGLFFTRRARAFIGKDNKQQDVREKIEPHDLGFHRNKRFKFTILTRGGKKNIQLYEYKIGGQTTLHLLHEENIGEVYADSKNSDHRLYQWAVLGFGGWQVMNQSGKEITNLHLNESSTSLTALAMWDSLMTQMVGSEISEDEAFQKSLEHVRNVTLLTNHTLEPAAEAVFTRGQYENFVLPNINNPKIKSFLSELIRYNGENMSLLDLGIFLAGKFNGVSKLHAELATQKFHERSGERWSDITFHPVTNAISDRWYPQMHELLYKASVLDEYGLPKNGFETRIGKIKQSDRLKQKEERKRELRDFLKQPTTKLGNNEDGPLVLPDDAIIIGWARRMAEYKRPGMLLDDLYTLKRVIAEHPNVHFVLSGKTHPTDEAMKSNLKHILDRIQHDDVLKKHVHFIQDYSIPVGKMLTAGCDIWVQSPIEGKEACGTSGFKAVANDTLVVSTVDGGFADLDSSKYLSFDDPQSLYLTLEKAIGLSENPDEWYKKVNQQLSAFLKIVAGGRMIKDYLNLLFPLTSARYS